MATKLILDKNTSFDQVNNYFKGVKDDSKVRARDLGGGKIELYVRKDSFKQFFTDKLRFDYLVKRDYKEAKRFIEVIIQTLPPSKKDEILKNIHAPLNRHTSYFEASALSTALNQPKESGKASSETNINIGPSKNPYKASNDADAIISANFRAVDKDGTMKEMLSIPRGREEVSNIINAVQDSADRQNLQRNFEALTKVLGCSGSSARRTQDDYLKARDFSRAWLKELPGVIGKLNSDTTSPTRSPLNHESDLINRLTDFSKRIEKWNAPDTIDYQGGEVGGSYANLVIVDPTSKSKVFHDLPMSTKESTFIENDESDSGTTTLSGYSDVNVTGGSADGLKINYPPISTIGVNELETLYKKIGEKIDEKIKSATPESSKGHSTADQLYIVHLPLLNPFKKTTLTPTEKDLVTRAFIKATAEWREKHPDLRIKVELPEGIDERAIGSTAHQMSERGQQLLAQKEKISRE